MAKMFVEESSLYAVADAIRAKGGTANSLVFPEDFVSAVENIQSGSSEPEYSSVSINVATGLFCGVYHYSNGEFIENTVTTTENTDGHVFELNAKIGDVIVVRSTGNGTSSSSTSVLANSRKITGTGCNVNKTYHTVRQTSSSQVTIVHIGIILVTDNQANIDVS